MKKEELMIGDWVYNTHNRQAEQVQEIGSGLVMLDYNDLYEYDEIEPIKLTTDILEANGFDYEKNVGRVFDDYSGSKVIYDTWNHELKILRDYEVILNIRSWCDDMAVHELQHAIRMCGVDMEIKLTKEG